MNDTLPGAVAGDTVAIIVTVWPNVGAGGVTLVSVVVVVIEALSKALKDRMPLAIVADRITVCFLRQGRGSESEITYIT
jgi:hypothetical protein